MIDEQTLCRRFTISGRVQGVFFRASTREQARQLALTGYARNLPDGRVEVLACGALAQINALAAWLATGPRLAAVQRVDSESVSIATLPTGFSIE